MKPLLETPIEYLTGVGPKRGQLLRDELGIQTFGDLLWHLPFRYIDKTKVETIDSVRRDPDAEGRQVLLKGQLRQLEMTGQGRTKRLTAVFRDQTGMIDMVWFQGAHYWETTLQTDRTYYAYGRVAFFNDKLQMAHPELEQEVSEQERQQLAPVYPSTDKLRKAGLDAKGLRKLMASLMEKLTDDTIAETLPNYIREQLKLAPLKAALPQMHFPKNMQQAQQALARLKFEELFYWQLRLVQLMMRRKTGEPGYVFSTIGDYFNSFYHNHLPFELTGAQKRVLKEIRADLKSGFHMNRLVQGDVGSGKTIVAFMVQLMALDNGYQTCLLAPTEILAQQHYASLSDLGRRVGIQIGFLSGSVKGKARASVLAQLADGSMHILVGTHALLEDAVVFRKLGLAVIDEQHRFGVEQRAKLWRKAAPLAPHILVMTATPIPRTLAMTLYGDLDVSVIDELPPGRKPITTKRYNDNYRQQVYQLVEEQIALGRQVYVVFPVIEETEQEDLKTLYEGFERLRARFPEPQYQYSIVHGKMKPAEKDAEMERFVKRHTHIMVATTVIEVGVNVPNASVMIIENAERFGLSQLHQLRGRVGRGADLSYCLLMHSFKLSAEGRKRLDTMCQTQDGFKIAEVDLEIRGPGNLEGKQQSGMVKLRVADLAKDGTIVTTARHMAEKILQADPKLQADQNRIIAKRLAELRQTDSWGKIS